MTELSNSLADLAERVREANAGIVAAHRRTAEQALVAGRLLIEAKEACRHGEWLPFLDRAGIAERTARNYMTLADSGLEIGSAADLGSIRAALAFLSQWRLPTFDQALFIYDPEREQGEQSVGRGIAYAWEDEQHRGHYHVGMIVGAGDEEQCIATRRPMLPRIDVEGDRPIDTILYFLTSQGFALPIAHWEIAHVDRRLVFPVLAPFLADGSFRDVQSAGVTA
ncbi:hypothetical protein [Arvimicrobium flavum]|uniref:hypothetical protein n=1 Tax=Arvimicrobium flavum TaxID=3393320 RepID=UPI00237B16EE|nr:hypothetical protein [Mesorhizobium shangrilense]